MNRNEVIDLLTIIAAVDNRQVGQITVEAWLDAIGDLAFTDCREAVRQHRRTSTEWLMPAHVRDLVQRVVDHRQSSANTVLPTANPDREAEYRAELADIRRRLGAAGNVLPFRAIPAAKSGPSAEFQQTREEMAERRRREALERARDVDTTQISDDESETA